MRLFPASPSSNVGWIVAAACLLAMLHFGREFLAPLALAAVLSLVVAPLKRRLARLGLGHTGGALASVLLLAACTAAVAALLVSQLLAVVADLPQHREAVRAKLEQVRDRTIRPLEQLGVELGAVVPRPVVAAPDKARAPGRSSRTPDPAPAAAPQAEPAPSAADAAARLLPAAWHALGQAGIVLVLLVFILLEHEGLRDRMLRLAGEAHAGRTMQAVEDAAQGVSRFFLAQLAVNAIFGAVLAGALWLVGVPHAGLWGALGALARFVPYLGALAAGAVIGAFAAAVDPGWALAFWSVGLFLLLELLVAHVVEPRVYGHSSGLAPLGVIVSALFWGVLWGPVGLLLATPITLCLVVAGRHVRALAPVSVLLGVPPGLTAGLRLYQRALSGEPGEIVAAAQDYLARSNFARFCDQVVLPGLALAAADAHGGRIGREQQDRIRLALAAAVESLAARPPQGGASRRRRSTSLLDANVGAHLQEERRQRLGSTAAARVPGEALVLDVGDRSWQQDLVARLLVQSMRDEGIQARLLAPQGEGPVPPPELEVTAVLLPDAGAVDDAAWHAAARELRLRYPRAMLVAVRLGPDGPAGDQPAVAAAVDLLVTSFSQAVAFVLAGRRGGA